MKSIISIAFQYCNDLGVAGGAIPERSVRRGWKDAWFLASFAGGGGGGSRSFTHFNFFFFFPGLSPPIIPMLLLTTARRKG